MPPDPLTLALGFTFAGVFFLPLGALIQSSFIIHQHRNNRVRSIAALDEAVKRMKTGEID